MYLFTGHTPCQPLPISNLNTAAIFIQWSVSMSALASYFCSTGTDQWARAGDDEVLVSFFVHISAVLLHTRFNLVPWTDHPNQPCIWCSAIQRRVVSGVSVCDWITNSTHLISPK